MHVGVDLNWFIQSILTLFIIALGLLYLVKNTASKYFEVDANFEPPSSPSPHRNSNSPLPPMGSDDLSCVHCGNPGSKKCSRCKSVRYCSTACQEAHWKSGHKFKCKAYDPNTNGRISFGFKGGRNSSDVALVPVSGIAKSVKKPKEVLFPYGEFIKLYNWDKVAFPPRGLLNCGNSCFANVVLQCLAFTRPLVAYLLEKGHQSECRRNDWCFLCDLQVHIERASKSSNPFSPISILSRLPNIGGNLGYGRQEDAHEFMRFAIDTMQSVCLDEYGGEKAVDPATQETTLIQHIFGGHLQSQVICMKCDKVSNQLENMMDLTVEIHGDLASLEECLDQFTAKEQLHGENMYKCDGCNGYVRAWKRLTIRRAPNILTIALKRFQSGRFGKLNKRVAFPEMLDLCPYTSERDVTDVYRLYAVVVHVDMLNASFFGHYICYIKDFRGHWYRVDDCKVRSAEIEEVFSQSAYMLLYSRDTARSTCLRTREPLKEEQKPAEKVELASSYMNGEIDTAKKGPECLGVVLVNECNTGSLAAERNSECVNECNTASCSDVTVDSSTCETEPSSRVESQYMDNTRASETLGVPDCHSEDSGSPMAVDYDSCVSVEFSSNGCEKDSCSANGSRVVGIEDVGNADLVNSESNSGTVKDVKVNGTMFPFSGSIASTKTKTQPLKRDLPISGSDDEGSNGAKRAEKRGISID